MPYKDYPDAVTMVDKAIQHWLRYLVYPRLPVARGQAAIPRPSAKQVEQFQEALVKEIISVLEASDHCTLDLDAPAFINAWKNVRPPMDMRHYQQDRPGTDKVTIDLKAGQVHSTRPFRWGRNALYQRNPELASFAQKAMQPYGEGKPAVRK